MVPFRCPLCEGALFCHVTVRLYPVSPSEEARTGPPTGLPGLPAMALPARASSAPLTGVPALPSEEEEDDASPTRVPPLAGLPPWSAPLSAEAPPSPPPSASASASSASGSAGVFTGYVAPTARPWPNHRPRLYIAANYPLPQRPGPQYAGTRSMPMSRRFNDDEDAEEPEPDEDTEATEPDECDAGIKQEPAEDKRDDEPADAESVPHFKRRRP